jgi:hypothetical protein
MYRGVRRKGKSYFALTKDFLPYGDADHEVLLRQNRAWLAGSEILHRHGPVESQFPKAMSCLRTLHGGAYGQGPCRDVWSRNRANPRPR